MVRSARKYRFVATIILLIVATLYVFSPQNASAATGINKTINFQGKVVNTNGTNVTNGDYSFLFCIYTVASPATPCTAGANNDAVWRESKTLTVTDGIFRTALGDTTTFPGSVDFNTDNIYLGTNFNSDGQMTPLVRFSAVPYAFNALKVAGLTVTDTTGTFTLAAAKTLTVNNTLTFAGTDATTFTFPTTSGGTVLTSNAPSQTVTSTQSTGTILGITDSTALTGAIKGAVITLSGTGVQDQTGLEFNLSNATGTNLNDIVGTGSTWKVSKTGVITVASCVGCGAGSQTPWGQDIDADNWSLLDLGPNITSRAALTLGSANNGAGASSALTATTGTGTTSTGALNINTGNASAGTAGNIVFDVGTSTSGNGSILLGTAARAQTITIGNTTGGTITVGQSSGSNLVLNDAQWSVTGAGAAVFATVNGNTITTGTGVLTLAAGKTLTANSSLTLAGTDSKTLTLSDSTTLNTNAITLAGGEVITFSASNALSLLTTGTTSVTLPTGGTLLTNTASAVQTITSTQSTGTVLGITDSTALSGAIKGLVITLSGANAQDQTGLEFNLSNATGTNLNDIVGTGSTWKVSRAGVLTVASCTGCGAGGTTLDTIGNAAAGATKAHGANAIVWNWGSLTSATGMTFGGGSAMTTGSIFSLGPATYVHTALNDVGSLANISFTDASTNGNNGGVTNGLNLAATINTTGAGTKTINGINIAAPAFGANNCTSGACAYNGLKVTGGSVSNLTNYALYADAGSGGGTNYAAAFMNGNVGIGIAAPTSQLHVANAGPNVLKVENTSANSRFEMTTGAGNPKISLYTSGGTLQGDLATNFVAADDVALWARTSKFLVFGTNNLEKMRIDTAGNVGIGVTPTSPLHLVSTNTSGTLVNITDSTGLSAAIVGQSITLSGAGVFDQTGLQFNLSNATGTNLNDIVGSGSTWKVSRAGAATFASVTSPTYTGAGAVTLSSGGSSGLTIDSASGDITVAANDGLTFAATTLGNNGSRNVTINSGTGGTTATLIVKLDTSGTVVTADTTTLNNAVGVAVNTTTVGQAVRVAIQGVVTATADNAVTAGDYIGVGSTTAGRAKSLGTTYPITAGVQVIGRALGTQATPGSTFLLMLNGLDNNVAAGGGGGVTTVGTIDSQAKSSNGAVISGVNIYMQTADTSNPGLISATGTQTFNGTKIFQSTTASNNAFQIQNTTGLDIANVNTNTTAQLVSNPSIEISTNGWSKKGAAGVVISSSDEVAAQYGSRELKIVTTAAIGDGATYNFQPTPSTAYSITFWAKSTGSTGANISFGHRDNTASGDQDCLTAQTLTTAWTQFTCSNFSSDATVNDTVPTIGIYVKQSDATARTIYIDGVTMVAAATGLTFDAGGNNFNIQSLNSNLTLNNINTGEIQPWQTNNNALPAVREDAATVTSNGFIYTIGGFDGTVGAGTTYYAKIHADGSIDPWTTGTALPNSQLRRYASAAVANGYVYVVGGFNTTNSLAANQIFYARLNSDGTTGTWYCQGTAATNSCGTAATNIANTNNLPTAKVAPSVVISNGFIYVAGGCSDNTAVCGTPTTTIHYAKLYADGQTGPWTATTQALIAARGMGSAAFINGYLYYVGGYNASPVNTVYYAPIAASGDITTAFSTTGAAVLPVARREQTSVVANGYLYAIGGCITTAAGACTAASNLIYYAKLNDDGSYGNWATNANSLPANRAASASTIANGYIYAIGGYDATARQATVYYASTARVLLGGTLDLVGLNSQSLGDYGGGGALTAGNGRFIGDLRVDGFVDLNNGLSVDSAINLNAISATAGQTVFNINNSSSNSIFSIKHMNTAFGSLANAGAFVDNMSYLGQEFNTDAQFTAITANAVVGDDARFNWRTTSTTATYSTPREVNGQAHLIYGTTTAVGSMVSSGTLTVNGNAVNTIFKTSNLPVMQMKFIPVQSGGALTITTDYFIGLSDTVTPPTVNDTLPANGVLLWSNNSIPATGGTLVYQGIVRSAGATIGTPVSCSGIYTFGDSITARIQVESATTARFLIDFNAGDGINFTDCGVVTGTFPTAQLSPQFYGVHNETVARQFHIDYMRIWQDDSIAGLDTQTQEPAPQEQAPLEIVSAPSAFDARVVLADLMTEVFLREQNLSDIIRPDRVIAGLEIVTPKVTANIADISLLIANNASISGTLTVDKIKANSIEGLDFVIANSELVASTSASLNFAILDNKIASISARLTTLENLPIVNLAFLSSSSDSAQLVAVPNLMVVGSTTLAEVSILNTLSVGNNLTISGSSINTLGQDLELQSLKQGGINLFGGLITFDTQGNINVSGVLSAQTVRTDEISITRSEIKVISETEVEATTSAGLARIKSSNSELKIINPKVRENSIIFIAPKKERNVPIYIKSQRDGEFIVEHDGIATQDAEFNFLIVN